MVPRVSISRATAAGTAAASPGRMSDTGPPSPRLSDPEPTNARRRRALTLSIVLITSCVVGGILSGAAPSLASLSSFSRTALAAKHTGDVTPIEPTAIVASGADLYVADLGRQEILKRTSSGRFSIVGGTGVAGLTGDGGSAKQAEIDNPSYLVALKSGSVLFEQSRPGGGSVIREITRPGVMHTVAGLHPSCAGLSSNATSVAADSAKLDGNPLSVDADGFPLLGAAQLCPLARRLGPFLRLTPAGELTNSPLSATRLVRSTLVNCGQSASGAASTAFLCASGGGHPKRLLVLRKDGTATTYPTYGGGAVAAGGGKIVAVRNDTIVQVRNKRLQTLASTSTLNRLVAGTTTTTVVALAVSEHGDIFAITDHVSRRGCTAAISEIPRATAHLHVLWSRLSRHCY